MGGNGGVGGGDYNHQSQIPEIDEPKPAESEKPKEPKESPCDKIGKVEGDPILKQVVSVMDKLATNGNKEYGMFLNKNAYGMFENGPLIDKGIEGQCGMEPFDPTGPVDGFVHTHFSGCQSIFSVGDIGTMYRWYVAGLINDPKNFTFTVVTPNTAYIVMIDDLEKFKAFGDIFLTGENSMLEDMFANRRIESQNSIKQNEQNFLFLMNKVQGGSGLKLFKGKKDEYKDYRNWEPKGLGKNNKVETVDCSQIETK